MFFPNTSANKGLSLKLYLCTEVYRYPVQMYENRALVDYRVLTR